MSNIVEFLYGQLFVRLPVPKASYTGKTVIVTGSNTGLGKEAARHFVCLGASTVVLAVRSLERGNAAKEDIESTTGCQKGVVQVWQIDMGSYQSVKEFAARAERELKRMDVVLLNAGVVKGNFEMLEDNEATVTINVVSTFLLAMLLLPKLKETAGKFNTRPTMTITSSEVHGWTSFKEKEAPDGRIFEKLMEKDADMPDRYQVSKLLEVLTVRAMAERRPTDTYPVTINYVNPGLCHSELGRESGMSLWLLKLLLARTAEQGSRTLVHAASQGSESHGQYMTNCQVGQPASWVRSDEGKKVQERFWKELETKLEMIQPGVTKNL